MLIVIILTCSFLLLEKHIRTTCTHQPKDCEFKEAGCQYVGHAKGLEEHYAATNTKKHLQLAKNSRQGIDKAMEVKIMMLSEQISYLRSEIHHVNREISVQLQPVASIVGKAENAIQNLQEGFSELALMVQTLQATSYMVALSGRYQKFNIADTRPR